MKRIFCILLYMAFLFLFTNTVFAQAAKQIKVSRGDSIAYSHYTKFLKKYDLTDLTQTEDSLFIRINIGTLLNLGKRFFEFKYNNGLWQGRTVFYGEYEYRRFWITVFLFKRPFFLNSKKTKVIDIPNWSPISPYDGEDYLPWDSVSSELMDLFTLRSRDEADTVKALIEDGIWYDIELSTPNSYRYLFWSNPRHASKSKDADMIRGLARLLYDGFELDQESVFMVYKKNKWR